MVPMEVLLSDTPKGSAQKQLVAIIDNPDSTFKDDSMNRGMSRAGSLLIFVSAPACFVVVFQRPQGVIALLSPVIATETFLSRSTPHRRAQLTSGRIVSRRSVAHLRCHPRPDLLPRCRRYRWSRCASSHGVSCYGHVH